MDVPHVPRSLRDPKAIAVRRQMLDHPHMAPLARYAMALRAMGRGAVPDFDPLDGGIAARALFLFEKPGPMTDPELGGKRVGSGFISRDNNDPTAEATFRFMGKADLPRQLTATWNIVPWWNGTRRITRGELADGIAALDGLLDLLPDLQAVVLVGAKAFRAEPLLQRTGLALFRSAHPSPVVRATRPTLWNAIPDQWSGVKFHLDDGDRG